MQYQKKIQRKKLKLKKMKFQVLIFICFPLFDIFKNVLEHSIAPQTIDKGKRKAVEEPVITVENSYMEKEPEGNQSNLTYIYN